MSYLDGDTSHYECDWVEPGGGGGWRKLRDKTST